MVKLDDCLTRLQADLRSGRFTSEAAVSQGAILPLLHALGWPIFNTRVVVPGFTVEGRRVDFALCHPEDRPAVFLEAKRSGSTEGADRQLFEYAFHKGVPMAVLTDGQEWHFYLPAERGDYEDRRVYKLDLVEREVAERSERLSRYLAYDSVCSGRAIESARTDYQDVARERQIKQTLPGAWQRLISEPDELLLELLADKVEDLCGFKPTMDACASFLKMASFAHLPAKQPAILPEPISHSRTVQRISGANRLGFVLNGQAHSCGSARETATSIFAALAQDSTFLERFAALKHGRKRRYIARSKTDLYPDRPDLAENCSFELPGGWFMGTNYSKPSFERMIRMACQVAGLKFGRDLTINLGD